MLKNPLLQLLNPLSHPVMMILLHHILLTPAPAADPTLLIFVFTLEEEEQTTLLSTHDHPISGLQLLVTAVDQVTEDTHPTPSPAVTSNDNTSSSPEDDSLLLRPAEVNYLVNLFR